jgi:hypothetical protein
MRSTTRYTLQRFIGRRLLAPGNRVCLCCSVPAYDSKSVDVHHHGDNLKLRGVMYCENIWACPVCSALIRRRRQSLTADLFTRTVAAGFRLLFVTFTLRHRLGQSLATVSTMHRDAWLALTRHRAYNRWRATTGTRWYMRALEVTHGSNGWHPHFHVVYVIGPGADPSIEDLYELWASAVGSVGGSVVRAAYDAQYADATTDADTIARYAASWGGGDWSLSHEVTAGEKLGRRGSRSPFQLAADAMDGDEKSAMLFREFADDFKGRRAQTWARGWLAWLEQSEEELNDESITAEELDDDSIVVRFEKHSYMQLGSSREIMLDAIMGRDYSRVVDIAWDRGIDILYISTEYFGLPSGRVHVNVSGWAYDRYENLARL